MKKTVVLSVSLVFLFGLMLQAGAAQEKKPINLDANNISNAFKIIEKNKALFNDPETLRKFIELSKALKNKK